jgi:hypothetical protein
MRRGVRADIFPVGRTSVQFDFIDQQTPKRRWWLVCQDGETDLCPTDPGFDVNLYITSDLETMARVWMGDVSVKKAIETGGLELAGSHEFRQRFEQWLGLSRFASIKDGRNTSNHNFPAVAMAAAPP